MTSRIPYKDPYVVKSQLVEQNDPFLKNEIACKYTVECHELGQKIRILGQGQEQDSSED